MFSFSIERRTSKRESIFAQKDVSKENSFFFVDFDLLDMIKLL